MYTRFTLFFLLSLALFTSCREEGTIVTTTTTDVPPPTVVDAAITAVTVDRAGNPVNNVTITGIPGEGRRHPDGSITIDKAQLSSDGTAITVTSPGHWPEHRLLMPSPGGGELRETFVMEPKVKAGEINPADGGKIELGENFSVELPADTYVTLEDGTQFDGPISVFVNHDAPEDADEMLNSPGNFLAQTADGTLQSLESYGMMDIAFEGPNGEPLVLSPNNPAKVQLPIKAETEAIAPDDVPFWVLDPDGFWLQEGFATLAPGCYIVYIQASGTCNIDVPHPVTRITGRFLDAGGFPLPHSPFSVLLAGGMTCGASRVDCDGRFRIDVAANSPLLLTIVDPCTDEGFAVPIDPVDANTSRDLGDIVIDLTNPAFNATVVDCSGSGLPDIGLTEIWVGGNGGNNGEYFAPRPDGGLVVSVVDCSGEDILVQAFTNDYSASSPIYRRDAEDYTTQEFVVCGELGPDEHFTLTIGDDEIPVTELVPIYWPDNGNYNWLLRAGADYNGETYSLLLQLSEPKVGSYAEADALLAIYRLAAGQDYDDGRVYVDPERKLALEGTAADVEGGVFEGSLNATMNLQNNGTQSVEATNIAVTATFRVEL